MPKQPPWALNRAELARIMRRIKHADPPASAEVSGPCWEWTGPTMPGGYGKVRAHPGDRERPVHLVMWEHYNGRSMPFDNEGDHLCRNRICCNPAHIEAVTPSVNTFRQDHANRRKTTCPRGHTYTPENTLIYRDGRRRCLTCKRERRASTSADVVPALATSVTRDASSSASGALADG